MSALMKRLHDHAERTRDWVKDPKRKPYRVSVRPALTHPGVVYVARRGDLVLGARDTFADALAVVDDDMREPWTRAQGMNL